ncbi:hypothetical protein [Endozoicomonas sp. ONNA1]|uniref:hypothetical protein n=1 Tax=Endozoicomonas sp. ONNA1 TaxID=2828740 RepID=UPI002148A9EC|nr:hypothetical protein [Endozoicomonas sp. ONNA1]
MINDFSLAKTDARWHSSQNHGEQTTSSVLPLVNVDSSALTPGPQSTGLQRRSRIVAIEQSCIRCLLPKPFRLHLDLRENERQLDSYRNSFQTYADKDEPLEAYQRNKLALRTLESNIDDNLKWPIRSHDNRRYVRLQKKLDEQIQSIDTLLEDNLKRATQSFSSIHPLLNLVYSELSEFIAFPDTLCSLKDSLKTLFDEDQAQHPDSGNAETLQLIYRVSCLVDQKIEQEQKRLNHLRINLQTWGQDRILSNLEFLKNLNATLNDMAVGNLCRHLDSLDTMESLIEFVENHEGYIRTLSDLSHNFLIQRMIKTIEDLPEELSTESLFLLDKKMNAIREDSKKIILKKASSLLINEVDSLAAGIKAFIRVSLAGLGGLRKDEVADRLFYKMCTFIKDFDDALHTFNKVTALNSHFSEHFDILYKKVVSQAARFEHFYQLTKHTAFDKDKSTFCLKALAINPDHIDLRKLHKKIIEQKIHQQFYKAVDASREVFIKNSQSRVKKIIDSQKANYQHQISTLIREPSIRIRYNEKIEKAFEEFSKADLGFRYILNRYDTERVEKPLKKAITLSLEAMIIAPTDEMRESAEKLIDKFFNETHMNPNTYQRHIPRPNIINTMIKKIKANPTTENRCQKIKEMAIGNLKRKLDAQVLIKSHEFDKIVSQKKQELDNSLSLHHQKLGSYYYSLAQMNPAAWFFPIDGFWMPYVYTALLNPEYPVNMGSSYSFDTCDVRGDLSPSTVTGNLSTPASGFLDDINVGNITDQPLDISSGLHIAEVASGCSDAVTENLSLDSTNGSSGINLSISDSVFGDVLDVGSLDLSGLGGSLDLGSLDVSGLDLGSLDVSGLGGSLDLGSFDVSGPDISFDLGF